MVAQCVVSGALACGSRESSLALQKRQDLPDSNEVSMSRCRWPWPWLAKQLVRRLLQLAVGQGSLSRLLVHQSIAE